LLKNKLPSPRSKLSEGKIKKLIHELEILQIELELQNEELIREKETLMYKTLTWTSQNQTGKTSNFTEWNY